MLEDKDFGSALGCLIWYSCFENQLAEPNKSASCITWHSRAMGRSKSSVKLLDTDGVLLPIVVTGSENLRQVGMGFGSELGRLIWHSCFENQLIVPKNGASGITRHSRAKGSANDSDR